MAKEFKMKQVHIYKDPMNTPSLLFFSKNSSFSSLSRIHKAAADFLGEGLPRLDYSSFDEFNGFRFSKMFRHKEIAGHISFTLKMW